MKIIALSFHYPPNGASGSIRNHKMLSALEREGVKLNIQVGDRGGKFGDPENSPETTVNRCGCFYPLDWLLSLRSKISVGTQKKAADDKTRDKEHLPSRASENDYQPVSSGFRDFITDLLTTPDRELMWFFSSVYSAIRNNQRSEVDLVYAIGKPWIALIAGIAVSRWFNKPLVIDFMDPWISNPTRRKKAKVLEWYESKLETWVIRKADWVIANTQELKEDFIDRYPFAQSKIGVITCGFDPADFSPVDAQNSKSPNEYLTVIHTGSLYAMRNPVNVLKALSLILAEGKISKEQLRFQFVGDITLINQEVTDLVESLTQSGILEMYDRMPYNEALKMLENADIAMIIQPVTKLQIPAKLYEYVSAHKPIFAIAEPDGAVERIVLNNEWGIAVTDEPEAIMQAIVDLYGKFATDTPLSNYTAEVVNQYSYPALASVFLQEVTPLLSSPEAK